MSRLVIVGAGGFGREIHAAVQASPRFVAAHHIDSVVFIDDGEPEVVPMAPVVSTIGDFVPDPGDLAICAIGSSRARRQVATSLEDRGLRFVPFVDDTARVGATCALSDGVVVCANSVLTADVTVGRHTHVNCNGLLGHDVRVGEFVTMSSGVHLTGHVQVGDDAFIATGAIVIPSKKVGAGATVGAGSVVLRSVKPGTTVFGNPARPL